MLLACRVPEPLALRRVQLPPCSRLFDFLRRSPSDSALSDGFLKRRLGLPIPIFHVGSHRAIRWRVRATGKPTLDLVSSDKELPTGALRQSDLTPFGGANDRVSADAVALSDLLQVKEVVPPTSSKGFGDRGPDDLAKFRYAKGYDHDVVSC